MQLFFNPDIDETTTTITFTKEESQHIVKVLRKRIGDQLNITNGKGWLFIAKITTAHFKTCTATIISKNFEPPSRDYKIHIAVAPTKMNERFEWFLEKATEIGIDTITPLICERSERKIIKIPRLKKIMETALKQSLQVYLPDLNNPISFKDFVSRPFNGLKYIAHCEETEKITLKNALQPQTDVLVLIGPEGDFSSNEIELAKSSGFIPVTLGNTRLRTETAALVACHSVVFFNE